MSDFYDKEGGPAFPNFGGPDSRLYEDAGMSIRDFFAAAALQGMLANPSETIPVDKLALYSYQIADAMLEERKGKEAS